MTVEELMESLGTYKFKEGKPFHGKKAFVPIYAAYAERGLPYFVIEDENGVRISDADEAIEYMNAGGFDEGSDLEDKFR